MPERLRRGPCADPVVACPCSNPIPGQSEEVAIHRHCVADMHQFLRLRLRSDADVDENFMKFWDLLAIVRLLHVNREVTGHTRNRAGEAVHEHPATAKHSPVDTPNALECKKPSSLICEIIKPSSSDRQPRRILGDPCGLSVAKTFP